MADREDELLHREHMKSDVVDDGDKDVQHENDWKDVTDDAGVKKRTIRAGTGETPELHSICLGTGCFLIDDAQALLACDELSDCLTHPNVPVQSTTKRDIKQMAA